MKALDRQELEIKFVAKLGAMGTYSDGVKKYHVMVPKQYIDKIENLEGKQVKIILTDEL
jgi:hypothetical protein